MTLKNGAMRCRQPHGFVRHFLLLEVIPLRVLLQKYGVTLIYDSGLFAWQSGPSDHDEPASEKITKSSSFFLSLSGLGKNMILSTAKYLRGKGARSLRQSAGSLQSQDFLDIAAVEI